VTKSGVVAGPRLLEHIVDAVLYFEGERHHNYRLLRAVKNRFGSTDELALFTMTGDGLVEVSNPSEVLLRERPEKAPGSVIAATIEGTRPLLVEVQALTSPGGGFGAPRRITSGLDPRRLALLLAVLEKRVGFRLVDQDVFISLAGGLRVEDPAVDLAVLCAVASSLRAMALPEDLVIVGEVGLSGEIRSVSQMDRRLTEAQRLGFRQILMGDRVRLSRRPDSGLQLLRVPNVGKAMNLLGLG
jgi:DNA repair protein RadA/Sms